MPPCYFFTRVNGESSDSNFTAVPIVKGLNNSQLPSCVTTSIQTPKTIHNKKNKLIIVLTVARCLSEVCSSRWPVTAWEACGCNVLRLHRCRMPVVAMDVYQPFALHAGQGI